MIDEVTSSFWPRWQRSRAGSVCVTPPAIRRRSNKDPPLTRRLGKHCTGMSRTIESLTAHHPPMLRPETRVGRHSTPPGKRWRALSAPITLSRRSSGRMGDISSCGLSVSWCFPLHSSATSHRHARSRRATSALWDSAGLNALNQPYPRTQSCYASPETGNASAAFRKRAMGASRRIADRYRSGIPTEPYLPLFRVTGPAPCTRRNRRP